MNGAVRIWSWNKCAFLLTLIAAWFLRLYRLDAQSLWYDEGTSATVAPRDLATILSNAANDIHPPLYYLLLHFWMLVTGNGEFAVRLPSAIAGLLSIAIVWVLGRRIGGNGLGLLGAILVAVSPLAVWYSQEARMYSLVAFLGILTTYLLIRAWERRGSAMWFGYGLAITVTLYSHYFAASILLAHGLAVGIWWLRRPRRRGRFLIRYVLASLCAAVLFLPWLIRTSSQIRGWPATSPPFGIRQLLEWTLDLLANGPRIAATLEMSAIATGAAIGVGLLFIVFQIARIMVGAGPNDQPYFARVNVPSDRSGRQFILKDQAEFSVLVVATLAMVPLAAMVLVSISRPFFHSKFLLLIEPPAELLIALGTVSVVLLLTRPIPHPRVRNGLQAIVTIVVVGGLVIPRLQAVAATWSDTRLGRDDYRGLSRAVAREAAPEDAIVLNAPGQIEIFNYYYRGQGKRYPLPIDRPPDRQKTELALKDLAAEHPRVWLVLWAVPESDPDSIVEHWLDERMFKTINQWYGGVRLALYQNPALLTVAPQRIDVGARFGGLADLASVEFVDMQSRPGGVVPVTLNWHVLDKSDVRFTVFVHILDPSDYLWGQRDSEPVGGARPTIDWKPGEVVQDRHGLPILNGTPPGEYLLEIGLYRNDNGARLPVFDRSGKAIGDRILISGLQVRPGAVSTVLPASVRSLDAWFATTQLVGRTLNPLGRDEAPPSVTRGEVLLLVLYWRSTDRAEPLPRRLRLDLLQNGAPPIVREFPFTQDRFPAENWSPNELIRDPYKLTTADLATGTYQVRLSLIDEQGRLIPARPTDRTGGALVGELVVR